MRSPRERRRPATLAGEHELTQGLSLPGRQITLFDCIWQSGRVGSVADGNGRPRFGMLRNLVEPTSLLREDADHLVG